MTAVEVLPSNARAARTLAAQWLAHLRRDARGLPVPWVNRWGTETAAATRIDRDPVVGRLAVFHDDHGDVPDFLRQNMGRQREAMMVGLCQVCGRRVPWSRRNLIVSSASCQKINAEDPHAPIGTRQAIAISEPWLDDRCAAIATQLCPALIRRADADDLHLVPVRSHAEATPVLSLGRLDLEALAGTPAQKLRLLPYAGRSVAMWVKIMLPNQRILVRDEATARGRS